jgi:hypothetical protein
MPSWREQVNWGNCGVPWVNCAVLCVKDNFKKQFWGLRYCLSKVRNLLSFFPSDMTSHSNISHFHWECTGYLMVTELHMTIRITPTLLYSVFRISGTNLLDVILWVNLNKTFTSTYSHYRPVHCERNCNARTWLTEFLKYVWCTVFCKWNKTHMSAGPQKKDNSVRPSL